MTPPRHVPSLRTILLRNLLIPTSLLAIVLGIAGSLLIERTIETAFDRVLDGSIRAIAERISVEDNDISVDLPQVALGMLETRANDSVYYSVSYAGAPVTGYADLPLADIKTLPLGVVKHVDIDYKGRPVRMAALAQPAYGKPEPVLVQVAETKNGRSATQRELLLALGALEAGIILTATALGWFAVARGLRPLVDLKSEIDRRQIRTGESLQPLDLGRVPDEVHPPVQAINHLFGRLEAAMTVIRDFIADASHQMKTPLASLRVHLALLARSSAHAPSDREAIAEIERSTRHLDRLIAQLIALARAEESSIAPSDPHGDGDLVVAAADAMSQLAPIAAARNIELALETDIETAVVRCNPHVLHEIMGNLIDNAIRYNRVGGSVLVAINAEPRHYRITISDDGPGIAAHARERVFDRFYRLPSPDAPSGSGLGLSIVRALLQQNAATIALGDGIGGRGLVVTLSFAKADPTRPTAA